MTVAALGRFADGFASWNKVLSSVPPDNRTAIFANACADVARYVARGLDRVIAVDELASMAVAHEIGDPDSVQTIISDAFRNVEPAPEPNGNGKNGHAPPVARILSCEQFTAGFVPPDYLIEGLIQRRFVYAMTGQTGHAKTAIALKLMELVASSSPAFLGSHRVEKGR